MTPAGDLQFSAIVKEDLVAELERQRSEAGIETIKRRVESIDRKRGVLILHFGDAQVRAQRVIVAIGRSGDFRKLDVPGENLDKVYNRLHDPGEFTGKQVLVVGGGDSAVETSIALALAGAKVTHSYRRDSFARPKPENVEKLERFIRARTEHGSICLALPSQISEIRETEVVLKGADGKLQPVPTDVVCAMLGRAPPLPSLR